MSNNENFISHLHHNHRFLFLGFVLSTISTMSFMDLLASRKAKLGGKYLLPGNDTQPLVGAETAADMGEEEVDMVELKEEEMVDKVNE